MADSEYFGIPPTDVRHVESRYRYVAVASQTTYAALYDIGYVDVFVNGGLADTNTYTAANGTSIVFNTGHSAGTVVIITARRQVSYLRGIETMISSVQFTATAGQTSFAYTYSAGSIFLVTCKGTGVAYTASSGTTVVLTVAATAGDDVRVYSVNPFSVANAVSKSGDTLVGPLILVGNATASLEAVPKQQLDAAVDALKDIPANAKTTSYTLALTDRGKSIDTTASVTIPASGSVAFGVGSVITVTNTSSASISLTPDSGVTIRLAGTSNTGARTIVAYGMATMRKIDTDTWFVTGAGVQ